MASIVQPTPRAGLDTWLEERLGLKGLAYAVGSYPRDKGGRDER